jgi:PEP-CTERM motif
MDMHGPPKWLRVGSLASRSLCGLLLAGLLGLPLATSANQIYFTVGGDGYAFGVSQADALASGLGVVADPGGADAAGYSIQNATLSGSTFLSPSAGATQNYTITNNAGSDAIGASYLVLMSFDTATVDGCVTAPNCSYDYPGSYSLANATPGTTTGVGFELSDAWTLVSLYDGELNQTLYFPAIELGDLGVGETVTVPLGVRLTDPATTLVLEGGALTTELMLPQIYFDIAIVPIPEPSTGLLAVFGISVLAWRGRRRPCGRS